MKLYYKDSLSSLTQGECIEVMTKMAEKGLKFDAIITDPPYGTTACKWDSVIPFDKMWNCLNNLRKENTPIILFGSEPFSSALRMSNVKEFGYDWIWEKDNASNFMLLKKQPGKRHENIMVFYKEHPIYNPQMWSGKESHSTGKNVGKIQGKREYIGIKDFTIREVEKTDLKYPISIIKFNACGRGLAQHPTQKPLDLMEYLINTYTKEGDTILDFTCGSGSTLVASKKLNRKCYGIELEEKYCEIAKNRLIELETAQ